MILHVACAADEGYIPHCAAMLHSLLTFNDEIEVHFLHSPSLPDALLNPLKDMVCESGARFHSHPMDPARLAGLPRLRNIPALMWYRIYLPEVLFDVDRVLYLDADTLVVGNLDELRYLEFGDACVAAVENIFENTYRDWPAKLGIPESSGYFNSGVLLLNLNALREQGAIDDILSLGRSGEQRLNWPDQDALNSVLHDRRLALHPRWNCQSSFFYLSRAATVLGKEILDETTTDPAIIHFEGGIKPWHRLSKHPYRDEYLRHRLQTPWPRVQWDGDTMFNRFLRHLPVSLMIRVLKLGFRIKTRWRRFLT